MNEVKIGKYKHFKGDEYQVIGVGKDSETLQEVVIYQALYGDNSFWVRPKSMFLEKVNVGKKEINRFEYLY